MPAHPKRQKRRTPRSAPGGPPSDRRPRHALRMPAANTLILAALALVALLVRLPHLGWGLPIVEEEALPMKKAFAMWGWDTGRIDWNPHTAGWPSLSFYLHLLIQHLHYLAGRWMGAFHDRGDYFVANWLDPGPLLLISRGVGVLAAAITVGVAARVALRLGGRVAALVVGVLLALAPLLVEQAQLVTPDILATLFAVLAVDRIVSIAARDVPSDDVWVGLWIGLGVSSKYTPILLVPGLLVTYGLRLGRKLWQSPRPWVALVVALAAFFVTSPFLLLDSESRARDVAQQVLHLTAGHLGGERGGGLMGYVRDVLGPGLGWSGLALGIVGLAWGAWRGSREYRALILCVVPYYLGLALLRTHFPRYVLPLLPPIAIGVSGAVSWIRSSTTGRAQTAGIALAALLAWMPAAIGTAQYHQRQGRPSTQSLADRFVRDASRQGPVYVAAEVLSLSVPTERAAEAAIANARLSPDQQTRMRSRPTYNVDFIPMYTVQPEEAARYYDIRHFTAHDLVVVTDAVRGRYLADTARFAPEARFYRELDRYAVLDARYSPGQEARGAEIRVYRMSSEAAERIGRDRGVLTLPPLRPTDRIHPSDYMEFVEGMARAAYSHGEWARASQYYGAMLQGADAGWMTEPERLLLMRMVADLEVRSGATADAARHYETYLRSVPDDSTARAALDGLRARSARVSSPSTR